MKERLVGAAVLVAIGAWLIPWVLDGPEQISQPTATALDLPVPSADSPPIRTETVVLNRRESPAAGPLPTAPAPIPATGSVREDSGTMVSSSPAPTPVSASPEPTPVPDAEPETASVGQAAANDSEWYIQIGAFGDRDNAERQAARVSTFGFDARVLAFPAGSGVVHRVRIGPQSTRERAEAVASSLSAHGFVAQVVFE